MHRIPVVLVLAGFAFAQKFEVASIKPSKADPHRVMIGMRPGGRFTAEGASLKQLVSMAYNVRDHQIVGLPAWADSDRYDIDAKPEGVSDAAPSAAPNSPPNPAQMQAQQEKMRAMLRDMLEDRFSLKIHKDSKEMPIYALVVAKGGPKLEEYADAPGASNQPNMMRMGRGQINANGVPIGLLVNQLAGMVGRSVIDKTGLTGRYNIKLTWSPDPGEGGALRGPGPGPDGPPPPSSDSGPSIFTALQEQLGLRLESQKGPVELIVVDKVEKPTGN